MIIKVCLCFKEFTFEAKIQYIQFIFKIYVYEKNYLFILFSFISLTLWSQDWCGNSYIVVSGTWYTGSNSYIHTGGKFHEANLGTFTTSGFNLGGELQVYPATDNPATLYYAIDDNEFVEISLPRLGTEGNNSKHAGYADVSLEGLANGSHTISVYFKAGEKYDSNNNANYIANFSVDVNTNIIATETGIKIFSDNRKINARFSGQAHIELYSITGQQLKSVVVNNEFSETVSPGIYVLRVNGKSHKVFVK